MFEGNQKLWVRVTLNIHDKMSPKFQNAFRVSVYSTCTCKVTMSPTGFPTLLNTVPRDPAGQGLAGTGQGVNFLPQLGRPLGFISHHNTDPEGCIIHEETICKVLQYIGGCQVRNQTPLLEKNYWWWNQVKKLNAAKVFKKVTTLSTAENIKEETLLSIKREDFFFKMYLKLIFYHWNFLCVFWTKLSPDCGVSDRNGHTELEVTDTHPCDPHSAPRKCP